MAKRWKLPSLTLTCACEYHTPKGSVNTDITSATVIRTKKTTQAQTLKNIWRALCVVTMVCSQTKIGIFKQ
jgi:hypothetical protein